MPVTIKKLTSLRQREESARKAMESISKPLKKKQPQKKSLKEEK
jgi:hypothetical protein